MNQYLKDAIDQARKNLDCYPSTAAWFVTGFAEARELGIDDLLRTLSYAGTTRRNDVEPLLDQLEEACK